MLKEGKQLEKIDVEMKSNLFRNSKKDPWVRASGKKNRRFKFFYVVLGWLIAIYIILHFWYIYIFYDLVAFLKSIPIIAYIIEL